jgi:hypothetical protein
VIHVFVYFFILNFCKMAYFNHAFRKCYVLNQDVVSTAGTATSALAAGQLALVDTNFESVVNTAWGTLSGQFVLAAGSYHTVDTIGNNPGHGGYSESVKSKGINPKYISRVWKTPVCTPTPATAQVQLASDCVPCGSSIFLRMDVKGSPALRFLNHNAYAVGDSANVCCVDGQDYIDPALALEAAGAQLLADPILSPFARERQFGSVKAGVSVTKTAGLTGVDATSTIDAVGADYSEGDLVSVDGGTTSAVIEILTVNASGEVLTFAVRAAGFGYSAGAVDTTNLVVADAAATGFRVDVVVDVDAASFSLAEVKAGTYVASTDPVGDGVSATLHVEGSYVDTQFGTCSFDTRDHYEKEPVQIILSNLDETGEPCNDCGVASRTTGVMAQTTGETVLRDVLMTERYMQMPYNQGNPDSARIREIEHSDDILDAVDRSARYVSYNLLHSVPRFNNPTGTFDNDQYLITIYVKSDVTVTQLDALWDGLAASAFGAGSVADTTDACGTACTIS